MGTSVDPVPVPTSSRSAIGVGEESALTRRLSSGAMHRSSSAALDGKWRYRVRGAMSACSATSARVVAA